MLISDAYRQQNSLLHTERPDYGTNGRAVVEHVLTFAEKVKAETLLDYGCGKGTLKVALRMLDSPLVVREYDPAVEGKDAHPEPADLVVCSDVLEHVEPECLHAVLAHLHKLSLKGLFFTVHTGPAKKTLPDGRNAHLTQMPAAWWLNRIFSEFDFVIGLTGPDHLAAFVTPREFPWPAW